MEILIFSQLLVPQLDLLSLLPKNLDDLAGLIEEVGMENLCSQLDLGLDCSFQ